MVSLEKKSILLAVAIISFSTGVIFIIQEAVISRDNHITLTTTTSTENSGLLDYLHPKMTEKLGINVDIVSVGTGAALEQARKGLADLVIVHAKSLEDQFISEGYGVHRVTLMSNDFIIVGPSSDPGQIKGLSNSSAIFEQLHNNSDLKFVSRGDNSGTHIREMELWSLAGIQINISNYSWHLNNPWYIEAGSGMSQTLMVASELHAYTITDRSTWLFMKDFLNLDLLAEGPDLWKNIYNAVLVNPEKFDKLTINFLTAKRYVQWLISNEGQSLIDNYTINGVKLFQAEFSNSLNDLSSEEILFWEIDNKQNTTAINRNDLPTQITQNLNGNMYEGINYPTSTISVKTMINLNIQALVLIDQVV
ncbi:MAG: substrate-binding domain-containing protein [Candidatus Kariarchaeaceae archaeon]|jgi:tungstate transport system substrate-binding protein